MIVMQTPKGWTGPKEVDGQKTEDYWRSHQVPDGRDGAEAGAHHGARGVDEELQGRRSSSTRTGRSHSELRELAPEGTRRMGANPHANGGLLLRELRMPDFRDYAVDVPERRARRSARPRASSASFLRDVMS